MLTLYHYVLHHAERSTKRAVLFITLFLIPLLLSAQSTYDAMAPFGFATCTSRTDAGNTSNITGGGCYVYPVPSSVASSKSVVTLISTGSAMDTEIKNAIANNDIIIFDGSNGDFILEAYVEMKNLSGKTLLGINNARLCTKWFASEDDVKALEDAGVSKMSTSSGGGTLDNGEVVEEEAEFKTRKIMIDRYNDQSEWWRKSGIFYISSCSNIIIRNLRFQGPGAMDLGGADLVSVINSCSNIWVDHCEFYDGQDGNFDITNYSDFVTVSWCTFSYTGRSYMHQNTNFCGSSDGKTDDDDKLSITWAYNMWGQGCAARMPMARFGRFHMMNNYYNCAGNKTSCMNPRINSEFLIEGNYFESNIQKIYEASSPTKVIWRGNNVYGSNISSSLPTVDDATATNTLIPYAYTLISPTSPTVKDVVSFQAGARLVVDSNGNFIVPSVAQSSPVIVNDLASSTNAYIGQEKTLAATFKYAESYQWYSNTSASNTGGAPISGATSDTYKFTPSAVGTQYYYCVATNSQAMGVKSVASSVCTVTVSEAPTMWIAASATYNSTSKGYEVEGVGTYYKSTSGGTTSISSDDNADWVAGKNYVRTSSNTFIFSPKIAVTGLKLYVIDSSARTLSNTACSITLNGTYSAQSSTADKGVASNAYTEVTITFNSTVAADQFVKVTFSGNVNVYGIEPITSQTPPTPQPTLYTITYNANGHGTCSTKYWTQTTEGQNTNLPSVTANSGYTFLGWATSSTATSAQYNAGESYTPAADVTLYAVYQQEQQGGGYATLFYMEVTSSETLQLSYQGSSSIADYATIEGGSATVYNGKNNTTPQNMVSGQTVSIGGSSTSYLQISLANSKTFVAGDIITITNAGNWKVSTTNNNSSAITITIPYTVKSEDAFVGKSDLYIFKTGTSGDPSSIKSITITRASFPVTYTVSYNLNGHGDAIGDKENVTELPTPLPSPTETGYTFDGWYKDSNLTIAATEGEAISANTTLYAKWTIKSYTVKFMDGTNELSSQSVNYKSIVSTPTAPVKDGYTFNGWSLTENGTVVSFPYTVTADVNFYAVWVENQQGGGDEGESIITTFDLSDKSGNTYNDTNNRISLNISKSSGNLNWGDNNRGVRWQQNTTFTFTAPNGYYISEITFVSNNQGNNVANMGGNIAVASGSNSLGNWNGVTAKQESYLWNANTGMNNPLSFTNNSTGDIYVKSITVTYVKLPSEQITIPAIGVASYVTSKALDFSGTGVTCLVADSETETTINLTAVTKVEAETPVILSGAEGTYDIPVQTGSVSGLNCSNLLSGSLSETHTVSDYENVYALSAKDGAFHKVKTGVTIPVKKAYLISTSSSGTQQAKALRFESIATNIGYINSITTDTNAYNLNGQRVNARQKGFVVINGKKYINR